jgi:quinate dehydrogenase (quinone)
LGLGCGAAGKCDRSAKRARVHPETPNVWTVPGFDKELNLVYLPTGNGPPDYWGGDRNEAKENTALPWWRWMPAPVNEWVFQTVHHDVWDYDLPSQPVLFHMKNDRAKRFRS